MWVLCKWARERERELNFSIYFKVYIPCKNNTSIITLPQWWWTRQDHSVQELMKENPTPSKDFAQPHLISLSLLNEVSLRPNWEGLWYECQYNDKRRKENSVANRMALYSLSYNQSCDIALFALNSFQNSLSPCTVAYMHERSKSSRKLTFFCFHWALVIVLVSTIQRFGIIYLWIPTIGRNNLKGYI